MYEQSPAVRVAASCRSSVPSTVLRREAPHPPPALAHQRVPAGGCGTNGDACPSTCRRSHHQRKVALPVRDGERRPTLRTCWRREACRRNAPAKKAARNGAAGAGERAAARTSAAGAGERAAARDGPGQLRLCRAGECTTAPGRRICTDAVASAGTQRSLMSL